MDATYRYRARALEVHDGDTYLLDVDLGLHVHAHEWIRLRGVNTPELNTDAGYQARLFVAAALMPGDVAPGPAVVIQTQKTRGGLDVQTFARYVADVQLPDGRDLATVLVDAGHATRI